LRPWRAAGMGWTRQVRWGEKDEVAEARRVRTRAVKKAARVGRAQEGAEARGEAWIEDEEEFKRWKGLMTRAMTRAERKKQAKGRVNVKMPELGDPLGAPMGTKRVAADVALERRKRERKVKRAARAARAANASDMVAPPRAGKGAGVGFETRRNVVEAEVPPWAEQQLSPTGRVTNVYGKQVRIKQDTYGYVQGGVAGVAPRFRRAHVEEGVPLKNLRPLKDEWAPYVEEMGRLRRLVHGTWQKSKEWALIGKLPGEPGAYDPERVEKRLQSIAAAENEVRRRQGKRPLARGDLVRHNYYDPFMAPTRLERNKGMNPLFVAAARGDVGLVKEMVRARLWHWDPYQRSKDAGNTAFSAAVINKHRATLRVLLDAYGAKEYRQVVRALWQWNNRGYSPVDAVMARGDVGMLQDMMRVRGFPVNKLDRQGRSLLHRAILAKDLGMIRALARKPAVDKLQRLNNGVKGKTPLQLLARVCKARGGDPTNIRDRAEAKTARFLKRMADLQAQRAKDRGEVVGGHPGSQSLWAACWKGDHKAVASLLTGRRQKGVDINCARAGSREMPESVGWTPLHVAAYRGDLRLARMLLSRNETDVWKVDAKGRTALHVAAGSREPKLSEVKRVPKGPGRWKWVDFGMASENPAAQSGGLYPLRAGAGAMRWESSGAHTRGASARARGRGKGPLDDRTGLGRRVAMLEGRSEPWRAMKREAWEEASRWSLKAGAVQKQLDSLFRRRALLALEFQRTDRFRAYAMAMRRKVKVAREEISVPPANLKRGLGKEEERHLARRREEAMERRELFRVPLDMTEKAVARSDRQLAWLRKWDAQTAQKMKTLQKLRLLPLQRRFKAAQQRVRFFGTGLRRIQTQLRVQRKAMQAEREARAKARHLVRLLAEGKSTTAAQGPLPTAESLLPSLSVNPATGRERWPGMLLRARRGLAALLDWRAREGAIKWSPRDLGIAPHATGQRRHEGRVGSTAVAVARGAASPQQVARLVEREASERLRIARTLLWRASRVGAGKRRRRAWRRYLRVPDKDGLTALDVACGNRQKLWRRVSGIKELTGSESAMIEWLTELRSVELGEKRAASSVDLREARDARVHAALWHGFPEFAESVLGVGWKARYRASGDAPNLGRRRLAGRVLACWRAIDYSEADAAGCAAAEKFRGLVTPEDRLRYLKYHLRGLGRLIRGNQVRRDAGLPALVKRGAETEERRLVTADESSADGRTLLLAAAYAEPQAVSHGAVLQLASRRKFIGLDVNKTTRGGVSAVSVLAALGRTQTLAALAKVAPEVDLNNARGGIGALVSAAGTGQTQTVLWLLNQPKLDVNQVGRDSGGATALHLAAALGETALVSALLSHRDIDVNKADARGLAPVLWAAKFGQLSTLRQLSSDPRVDLGGARGGDALRHATRGGHKKCVKFLAENYPHLVTAGGGRHQARHAAPAE